MLAVYRLNTLQAQNSGYSAVGRVSNYDGWKGHGKDTWEQVSLLMVIHYKLVVQDSKGKIARPQDVKW